MTTRPWRQIVVTVCMAGWATAAVADDARHLDAQPVMAMGEARARCSAALVGSGAMCEVGAFGHLGVVAGHEFLYARYDFKPAPGDPIARLPYSRIVIFQNGSPSKLQPILISSDDAAFEYGKPAILHSGGRILLRIPADEDGTGNFNRELLYVWQAGAWHDVDITSWLDELQRRLPNGLGALKGIFPDYATMKAGTPIWHAATDSNACPTAGHADISLAWSGDRVVLAGVRLRTSRQVLNHDGCSG